MASGSFARGAAALARADLSLDVQIYPKQVAEVARLSREVSDLRIIVNHTAMPRMWTAAGLDEWRHGINELGASPNVAIKFGGVGMTAPNWPSIDVMHTLNVILTAFGPERVMFGSNVPVESLRNPLSASVSAFRSALQCLTASEREMASAGTATAWYRLPHQTATGLQDPHNASRSNHHDRAGRPDH
jgi:predicted TIM-barrel fold metal-dependent hydrolase